MSSVAIILHKDKKLAQQMSFDCPLQGLTKAMRVETAWLGGISCVQGEKIKTHTLLAIIATTGI